MLGGRSILRNVDFSGVGKRIVCFYEDGWMDGRFDRLCKKDEMVER